jgi:ankyrin repeat protein
LMKHTPIRVAVRNGHASTVKVLVQNGAAVREPSGWTALIEAARLGHAAVVVVLVAAHEAQGLGADATGGVNTTNIIGESALMLAAGNGDTHVVQTLLHLSANKDAQDSQGSTALMKAAGAGHTTVAMLLLKEGVDVSLADDHGDTAVL